MSAVNPVGTVKIYFEASAPPIVWVDVTTIPVPTVTLAKVPVFEIVTTSPPTTPTKVEPEIVAASVLVYILLSAVAPETVSVFWAMVITNVAFPEPPPLVAMMVTLNIPTTVGVPVISPVVVLTVKPAGKPVALKLVGVFDAVIV